MKTINKIQNSLAGLTLFSLLTGCMPCYYSPNSQNVTLFTQKWDGNGTFNFQFGGLSVGLNGQGALALTDHMGIMGNCNYYTGRGEKGTLNGADYSCTFSGKMGEIGLGYYLPFKGKAVFETYAGIGRSRVSTEYEIFDGDGSSSIGTTSFFIQPAIGYYNKHVQLAFSSRFRIINFRDVKYNSGLGNGAKEPVNDLQKYPTAAFFEPAFTLRSGGRNVKFQLQAMFSVPIDNSKIVIYDPVNINIGIVFCIHPKKKSNPL